MTRKNISNIAIVANREEALKRSVEIILNRRTFREQVNFKFLLQPQSIAFQFLAVVKF